MGGLHGAAPPRPAAQLSRPESCSAQAALRRRHCGEASGGCLLNPVRASQQSRGCGGRGRAAHVDVPALPSSSLRRSPPLGVSYLELRNSSFALITQQARCKIEVIVCEIESLSTFGGKLQLLLKPHIFEFIISISN